MNIQISAMARVAAFAALLMASGCTVTQHPQSVNIYVDDRTITATIKALHAQNTELATSNISVETLYGVVLLSGVAKSLQGKMAATNIAEQVDGVKAVHDEVHIQADASGRNTAPRNEATPVQSL